MWAQLDVSNHEDDLVIWMWELELERSKISGDLKVEVRRMKVNIMNPRSS